jgi:hypothetical protein
MDPQDSIAALLAQYMGQEEPQPPAAIYRGGQREQFVPKEMFEQVPREFVPDRQYQPPPPEDPNAGSSAGNENPMLTPKSKRILSYTRHQIERRPYVGKEIPMEEFDKHYTTSPGPPSGSPPGTTHSPYSSAIHRSRSRPSSTLSGTTRLRDIDPRMAERYRSFGLGGATDSDMEYVYGKTLYVGDGGGSPCLEA